MKKKVLWSVLCCLTSLAFLAGGAWGRIIIVDDPGCPGLPECYTLQDALNEAGYDELQNTILVAPGTYVGNFYYGSSHMLNLMAMEGADPTLTILDGNHNGTVLRLLASNVGYVHVEGFTIRDGHGTGNYGGGIHADMPSGYIALYNNIITDNDADNYGGGIHAKTSSGYIELYNNIITENYALDSGGGVFIYSNSSSGTAGTVSLFENTITNNYAEHSGGGVYARSGSASGTAGSITLINNVIASNLTNDYGGGVAASSYTPSGTAGTITFTNNTITGNAAGIDGKGGHLYIFGGDGGGTVNFYNNICWGNTGSGGDVYLNKGSGVAYRYNNDATISGSSWDGEDGNINADPLFVGGGNYHLQGASPCIDKGLNSAPELTSYDFEGDFRPIDGDNDGTATVDIGADEEFSPSVINPISDASIKEGTPYTGPTPSLSQGTPPVTWSLVAGPSGMGIDSGTGVVSWSNPTVSGSPHLITIQATNTAGSDTESWLLSVEPPPGVLSVTPAEELSSSGSEGGPFDPSSKDYTLENTGEGSINWTASKTQDWVTLSATGGSLAPAASTTVTVSINSTANSLTADTYNDTVTFTNTTNGDGNTTRDVMLIVEACPLPAEPANPSPADDASDISTATDLDWDDSNGATSYDVYLGTTYPPEKVGTVSTSAYDPGLLDKNTIYYWRVVAKNDCGETTGDLWQFTTAQEPIHIILHRDGALWSSDTGWEVNTPPYYPGTGYARALALVGASYKILHRDGAIYDSATGWVVTSPPYYPGTAYAVDLKVTGSGEEIILHRDGALWSTSGGWTLTAPPYYPGTAYAKALQVRTDNSYVILHRDGAIYDSASGWVMTSPPYYPSTAYAVDMKLNDTEYVILHQDGALWSSDNGWILTAPPYYPGTAYARALQLVGNNYVILHKDGAIYNSVAGWITTTPPYYPGTAYAVDLEVQ